MRNQKRRLFDRAFTGLSLISILLLILSLVFLLAPIFIRGSGAFFFKGTVEHRRLQLEQFNRGDPDEINAQLTAARKARQPLFRWLAGFEKQLADGDSSFRQQYRQPFKDLKTAIKGLLGPLPGDEATALLKEKYGQTRWDRALIKLDEVLFIEEWDYSRAGQMGSKTKIPRVRDFKGSLLEPLFPYLKQHAWDMLLPKFTFYWGFLTDVSLNSHFFGGIWPELLGTIYLTFGAILLAVPLGLMAAIYLAEFAGENAMIGVLRTCISTLAGVPSIIFGLFGLAFFIGTLKVSGSKSILAGSMTLALLVLPTIIRASEEALRAVPHTYKEASLSLGASRWQAIRQVMLPAALPGILTGIIISIGRAAGETAPIIFTAAVSVGGTLKPWEIFSQPTPALPWNIYNLATEHQAVDEIRHVQYGMVLVLVLLVLLLNLTAIFIRARVAKKLHS